MARVCLRTRTSSQCQVYSSSAGTPSAYVVCIVAMKASSSAGPERYILALALLVPLVLGGLALAQLPGASLSSPTSLLLGDASANVVSRRPAPSNAAPPPTLVPPTATVRPTATAAPPTPTAEPTAEPTATPQRSRTYVVQKGDQLKYIA